MDDILGHGGADGGNQDGGGSGGGAEGGSQADGGGAGGAGGEGEHPKWHGVLPKEYQGHAALTNVEGMESLLKSFVGLKANEGAVVIPGKDASDEVKAAFFKELGVPVTSAEYTGDMQDVYKQLFHNVKLSQGQADELYKGHEAITAEIMKAEQTARDKATDAAIDALKTEYGADYDKNVNIASSALKEYMNDDAYARLKEKGFTSDPDVVEMFYRVGKATMDDSALGGSGSKAEKKRPVDEQGRSTFEFSGDSGS